MKQLPFKSKTTVFMRNNLLRQAIVHTKEKVLKAEEFFNGLGFIVPVVTKEKKLEKGQVWLI